MLAPAAKLRPLIIPKAPRSRGRSRGKTDSTRHIPWAELLRRVFKIDILECQRCGGRREVIALITNAVTARTILEHLGLDAQEYGPVPARPPPQLDWVA